MHTHTDVLADMPADPLPLAELLPLVSSLVVADLAAAGLQPDETVLCQLARVAAITGDADKVGGCVCCCAVQLVRAKRCVHTFSNEFRGG
jgi:hypothetical protein